MILIKWQYGEILPTLIADILPFLNAPYLSFQKNETLESQHNCLLNNWGRFLN